jgi:tripartite ATP-independent transporter DctM subunit
MSEVTALLILIGLLLFLLAIGMPVAFCLLLSGTIAMALLIQPSQLGAMPATFWRSINSYSLTAVPLFIFMAEVLHHSKIAENVYKSVDLLFGRLPGGAAYTNIFACAIFAAMSGSSVANAAAIGTIAIPEMIKQGYSKKLSFGSIAGGGTLGILIPPSIALIIYGSLTGVSVGHLFLAGVVPGIILTGLFVMTILVWGILQPNVVPTRPTLSSRERLTSLFWLAAPAFLILTILGGIYAGLYTPSEAGVMGAIGAVMIVAVTGQFSLAIIKQSFESTIRMTCMILLIIGCASIFTYVVGYLGTGDMLNAAIITLNLPLWGVLLLVGILYIILGMFIESVSLMILTIPIITPLMQSLGVDLLWYGIFMVLLIEFGLITPPVGLNLYILQGITSASELPNIIVGSIPFLAAIIICLVLITVFPTLVTWFPGLMVVR